MWCLLLTKKRKFLKQIVAVLFYYLLFLVCFINVLQYSVCVYVCVCVCLFSRGICSVPGLQSSQGLCAKHVKPSAGPPLWSVQHCNLSSIRKHPIFSVVYTEHIKLLVWPPVWWVQACYCSVYSRKYLVLSVVVYTDHVKTSVEVPLLPPQHYCHIPLIRKNLVLSVVVHVFYYIYVLSCIFLLFFFSIPSMSAMLFHSVKSFFFFSV